MNEMKTFLATDQAFHYRKLLKMQIKFKCPLIHHDDVFFCPTNTQTNKSLHFRRRNQ